MAQVGVKELSGIPMEFHATMSGGWQVYEQAVEGDERDLRDRAVASGDTIEKAENNARAELAKRKVKVSVHFITEGGARGVAYGWHARTRKILVRVNDKAEQFDSYRYVMKPDTPQEDVDHLREIREEMAKLKAEERTIKNKYKLDLGPAVTKAIDEAVARNKEKAA